VQVVNGIIGAVLLVFAVLHAFVPSHFHISTAFGLGALCAFLTLIPGAISTNTARIFALGTTAVMFFYFACFFTMAREFQDGWVRTGSGLEGLGLLLAAFMMIPILSCYSCLLKADGCEQPTSAKGAAFFRVPDDVKEH
jgi:hypothetical protein